MHEEYSKSDHLPYANANGCNFGTPASFELYRELMGIAKEIETCRASL